MRAELRLRRWASLSNQRAIANARAAAVECSRRRVERAEVDEFLAAYAAQATGGPQHSAWVRTDIRVAERGR